MASRPRTQPRKQARQARARATVDAILEGAARILERHGYDHASTNRIAEAAGVSIGSLYQYFPGKEAVIAALVERHMAAVAAAVEADIVALAARPPAEAVPILIRSFFTMSRVNPRLRRVLIEQVPRVGALVGWARLEARASALVAAYLAHHAPHVADPALAAHVMVRAVAAITYDATLGGGRHGEAALTDELARLILARLARPHAQRMP